MSPISAEDEGGLRERGARGKISVFGLLERDGRVKVQIIKNITAETLMNLKVRTVKHGSIIYTDKVRSYDALMCCGYRHLKVDHGQTFLPGQGLYQRPGRFLELRQRETH